VIGDIIILVAILLVSVVIHENAHGWTALALGDPTAKAAGRLTLNPVPHLDPVGSFILPAFVAVASGGQSTFGYARPVPVTPSKLKGTDKLGFAIVALAGPVSNLVMAFIAAVVLKMSLGGPVSTMDNMLIRFFQVNLYLAAFNLIPVPPLDGSRLLRPFIGDNGRRTLDRIEPYGFVIILLLITVLDRPFFRIVNYIVDILLRLLPL
jgi:Zn-dependent protease